jgi:drug/metabolite transporter (DMT)-like permease
VIAAYVAAFLGVVGHATSEFFVKLSGLAGPEVSVWRFMIGGGALVLVSLATRGSRDLVTPLLRDPVPIVGLSILGMALAQFLFHWALDFASVVQVATMVTAIPIFVVFVARVINKTPVTTPKMISGAGAFLGCLFLLTDGYVDLLADGSSSLPGVLLALACALLGAIYLVLVKPWIIRYGSIRMTTYTFALGFLALWPVVGLLWGVWVDPSTLFERSAVQAGSILTLGIWNTCIGFILWLWGLSHVPDPARGNYLFFLKPVIAALLAYFILDDRITVIQVVAIAAITGFVAAEIFYDQLRALLARRRDSSDGGGTGSRAG